MSHVDVDMSIREVTLLKPASNTLQIIRNNHYIKSVRESKGHIRICAKISSPTQYASRLGRQWFSDQGRKELSTNSSTQKVFESLSFLNNLSDLVTCTISARLLYVVKSKPRGSFSKIVGRYDLLFRDPKGVVHFSILAYEI